jgi:hypothetical protein
MSVIFPSIFHAIRRSVVWVNKNLRNSNVRDYFEVLSSATERVDEGSVSAHSTSILLSKLQKCATSLFPAINIDSVVTEFLERVDNKLRLLILVREPLHVQQTSHSVVPAVDSDGGISVVFRLLKIWKYVFKSPTVIS